jgi:hypothetical protein
MAVSDNEEMRPWAQITAGLRSAQSPGNLQSKKRDGDLKRHGIVPSLAGFGEVNPGHGAHVAGEVTSAVVFENPTWQNFRLNANNTGAFDVADMANGVHNVPLPLDNLDAAMAPVFDGDAVRENELLFVRVGELWFEFAPNMNANAFGCSAVYPRPVHAFNLRKKKVNTM